MLLVQKKNGPTEQNLPSADGWALFHRGHHPLNKLSNM